MGITSHDNLRRLNCLAVNSVKCLALASLDAVSLLVTELAPWCADSQDGVAFVSIHVCARFGGDSHDKENLQCAIRPCDLAVRFEHSVGGTVLHRQVRNYKDEFSGAAESECER